MLSSCIMSLRQVHGWMTSGTVSAHSRPTCSRLGLETPLLCVECSLRNGALSSLGNELLRKQNFWGHGTRSRAEVTWVTSVTVAL
jgi:hypothetical protein